MLFIGVNISHQFTARCLAADSMHDRIHGWHNGLPLKHYCDSNDVYI